MTNWPLLPVVVAVVLIAANPQFGVPSLVIVGCIGVAVVSGLLVRGRGSADRAGSDPPDMDRIDRVHRGVRTRGVVTGMREKGAVALGCQEVELDLMVSRPEGGQFAASNTAIVPVQSLPKVSPGSIVGACYRHGDESVIAVRVPRGHALSALRRRRT